MSREAFENRHYEELDDLFFSVKFNEYQIVDGRVMYG